jgi:glycosyltransferase involved in cell wall biosynthesis
MYIDRPTGSRQGITVRVMFDSQIFCSQRFGGISRYIVSIAAEMEKLGNVVPRIVAPFHYNEHLEQLPKRIVYGRKIPALAHSTLIAYAAGALPARIAQHRFRPDIVHNTYYYPAMRTPGAAKIMTVHDMIHEKYPSGLSGGSLIARWKAASVSQADHVICVSESTRRDVLTTYGVDENRVSVTHLGCDAVTRMLAEESSNHFRIRVLGSDSPYILYVGSRVGYKNFDGLLRAYAMSPWLRNNFHLLCFGGGDFTSAERSAISSANVTEGVKYVGGSDEELAGCYSYASLFICPSHYEGFGLPPLEAMSFACPVACSDTSSLPEVVGDAALMFDPKYPEAICVAMETVLNSPSLAASLVERGRARIRNFSWQKCAQNTVAVYKSVLGY